MKHLLLILAGAALSIHVSAREVDNLDSIARELSIAEDVFRSSMKNSLPERVRISGVDAQYLARQGVVVSMNVAVPWMDMDSFAARSEQLGSEVESVEDVPELVHGILAELNAAFSGYPPEEMAVLTQLRSEQREVRRDLRASRSGLRALRRNPESDAQATQTLEAEIGTLNRDLEALEEEVTIEQARIEALLKDPERSLPSADVDEAVADTVCNYGATFKSLGSQQYLTLAVRTRESVRYYVFRMEQIHECRRGNLTREKLLARSFHYLM